MSDAAFDPVKRAEVFFQSDVLRVKIIVAYWSVVLCAVPLWWYTTSITRLPLPTSRVDALGWTQTLKFPVDLVVSRATADSGPSRMELENAMQRLTHSEYSRWSALDVRFLAESSQNQSDVFSIAFDNSGGAAHTLGSKSISFSSSASTLPQAVDTLADLLSPYRSSKHEADGQRIAKYSPKYRLSFTLLNEDVSSIGYRAWEIEQSIFHYLEPTLKQLRELHEFVVESHVQFSAPLAFQPERVQTSAESGYWALGKEETAIFVNSAEWTLSSSASNDPVLHFIVFIPSSKHRPMHVMTRKGGAATSNAFIIPQWGGIVVFNPEPTTTQDMLTTRVLQPIFQTFHTQLQLLLGVPPTPQGGHRIASQGLSPVTHWQLAALQRARTLENVQTASEALRSIIALVNQIGHLPVREDVRALVRAALDDLELVRRCMGDLPRAFAAARDAASRASAAFFDPGMLAMLYFPAEHTYAVYTPLFAPVGVPLIVSVLRELKRWRKEREEKRKRREEKGKARMDGERPE